MKYLVCVSALLLPLIAAVPAAPARAAEPPTVVTLAPAHEAVNVDATKTRRLVVTFDRPMQRSGWSFCGGGPAFPKLVGTPRWQNARTCVVNVELEADHDYSILLNCPAGGNFRSADGVKAPATPWSFATLPAKLPDQRQQRALNRKALAALQDLLATHYSYYELRDVPWRRLFGASARDVLTSETTRVWAAHAGKLLAPAADVHLTLRHGDNVIATGRRSVDPLFRGALLPKYLAEQRQVGEHALVGRTGDGIGYLLIREWTAALDLDAVEAALGSLRDAKGLVVDVRLNSGGDELLARRFAQWFVTGTRVYARNRYRTGKGKDGFGPVLDREITGNDDEAKRFAGPVVVLTSPYVMSSCEAFVLMMKQGEKCTVVGQRTYGSSGNPKPHELPNGVTVSIPSWQALLPDGTCFEAVGIAPDVEVAVEVEAAELDSRDPILERGLEVLRGGEGRR